MNWRNESGNTAFDGYGQISNALWRHSGFRRLNAEQRLAYIFLLSGPPFDPSGLFAVDPFSVSGAVTSEPDREEGLELLGTLESRGFVEYDEPVVWVKGMREHYASRGADVNKGLRAIDRDNEVLGRYLEHYGLSLDGSKTYDTSPMTLAVAKVTKKLLTAIGDDVRTLSGQLAADGFTAQQVLDYYGKDGWWYTNYWKGQKGQWPTLKDIKDTILPASEGWRPEASKASAEAVAEVLAKGLASSGHGPNVRSYVERELGPDVSFKLFKHKKTSGWRMVKEDQFVWQVMEALNG